MDNSLKKKRVSRKRRVFRVRNKLKSKPRLCVFKSNSHIYAQIIDGGNTICSASTLSKEMKEIKLSKKSKEAAKQIGKHIAALAKEKKCETIVFDRGRYKFHGILAELANSAREAGLKF